MKKTILILCAALLSSAAAAQLVRPYYGITAGINIANVSGGSGNTIARYNAGFFGGFTFTRFIALQAELLYSGTGAGQEVGTIDGVVINDKVHFNLNYIILPITAKVYLIGRWNVGIGIQPGVLVSQRYNYRGDKYRSHYPVRKMDLAIPMGIGYDFGRLGVYARYQQGLINIFNTPNSDEKNSLFAFNLSFRI